MIVVLGLINFDFVDVKIIMIECGFVLMGIGEVIGENCVVEVVCKVIMSLLLEIFIEGVCGVIMNIIGGINLLFYEVNEVVEIVIFVFDLEVNMIFGVIIDENLKEEIKVMVIVIGFEDKFVLLLLGCKLILVSEFVENCLFNFCLFGN